MNEKRIWFEPRTKFRRDEDPHLRKVIIGKRQETPTGEMNIAKMNNLVTCLTTTTKMILEGKVISLTKHKITEGRWIPLSRKP